MPAAKGVMRNEEYYHAEAQSSQRKNNPFSSLCVLCVPCASVRDILERCIVKF